MSKRYIYLIRHAQADTASLGKGSFYIGQTDLALSNDGIENAKCLAKTIAHLKLDSIYSSDLKRAKKTAQIISEACGIEPIYKKEFREINLGKWEGLSFEYVKSSQPLLYAQRGQNLAKFVHDGCESFESFTDRIWTQFEKLIYDTSGDIALVSHAGVNRVIICKILSIPLEKQFLIEQSHCCFNIISVYEDKFKIELLNYNSNLNTLLSK
jgi:probable phosphoglycerate mutase